MQDYWKSKFRKSIKKIYLTNLSLHHFPYHLLELVGDLHVICKWFPPFPGFVSLGTLPNSTVVVDLVEEIIKFGNENKQIFMFSILSFSKKMCNLFFHIMYDWLLF